MASAFFMTFLESCNGAYGLKSSEKLLFKTKAERVCFVSKRPLGAAGKREHIARVFADEP